MRKASKQKVTKCQDIFSIPNELLENNLLNEEEISNLKTVLNKKTIDSNNCFQLVKKITGYYENPKEENVFLYNITFGIISFLLSSKNPKPYFDSFEILIQRKDVQSVIFQNPTHLYEFYAIIFNGIKDNTFGNIFIDVSSHIDVVPNIQLFWSKFYNFLYDNFHDKRLKKPKSLVSTFRGDKFMDNLSDKLKFFAIMGTKSFRKAREFSLFYDYIFLCIVTRNFDNYDFLILLMQADYEGATDALIKYIKHNTNYESYELTRSKEISLYDLNFSGKIITILETLIQNPHLLHNIYVKYLIKACVPLISNREVFKNYLTTFHNDLISFVKNTNDDMQQWFFFYLLRCKNGNQKIHMFKNKLHIFDSSLRPSLDDGINFLKEAKSQIDPRIIYNLLFRLIHDINIIQIVVLKPILMAYLEMYPDQKASFINDLTQYWKSQKWLRKYNAAIREKTKTVTQIGKDLDTYLNSLISKANDIQLKSNIPLQNQTNNSNVSNNSATSSNNTINNDTISNDTISNDTISNDTISEDSNISDNSNTGNDSNDDILSTVSYDIIIQDRKQNNQFKIEFDKSVTIKHALRRISMIAIHGKDEGAEEKVESKEAPTLEENIQIDEHDLKNEDDSLYHTMKLGRSSFFCKEGMLFGHQKISADVSHREPIEVFGLSNYIDRSTSFNSLSFPNNKLYVRLVPIRLLYLPPSIFNMKKKNIVFIPASNETNNDSIDIGPSIDNTVFDHLSPDDFSILNMITRHPPTKEEASLFLKLNKDINKFREQIYSSQADPNTK